MDAGWEPDFALAVVAVADAAVASNIAEHNTAANCNLGFPKSTCLYKYEFQNNASL